MAITYERLNTNNGDGSSTTISLTNLSQSYTHLRIIAMVAVSSGTPYLSVRFNNDSSSIYDSHFVGCTYNANTIESNNAGNQTSVNLQSGVAGYYIGQVSSSGLQMLTMDIPYYNAANGQQGGAYTYIDRTWCIHGMWSWGSTSAITRIDVISSSTAFTTTSSLSAYGILKA